MPTPLPVALTIAGSDPSGGAGIQADLKTFHHFGVYGEAAVTLIAVQNSLGVSHISTLDAALVSRQIAAVITDIPPAAAKTGALGNAAIIDAIASSGLTCPLVIDPVMRSKNGSPLLDPAAREALIALLLPQADLVTPNAPEAADLADFPIATLAEARRAAERIATLGPRAVLIKGGHLDGEPDAVDLLFHDGAFTEFRAPRAATPHTHGTGCALSAAITASLALGHTLPDAVAGAKEFLNSAIAGAPGLGAGHGPLDFWAGARRQPR
jgi:hydroxymethylpyrimidine/phosphomethylpyrimidine kinase